MKKIAVLNQKGGVGKTTTVANTTAALAAMGCKVVAIDLDPQAHLTIHLGLEPQRIEGGAYEVLTQSADFEQQILLTRLNLWLLPANINLVGAETELVSVVGRETILGEAIRASEDKFDYCFIDCPPSLGLLTLNALAAVEEVLIPLQPHFLALQGLGKLLQTVELVNRRINPKLKVKGILLCMFDTRASLPNEVKADIEQFLENARGTNCAWSDAQIFPTYIRRNIKLAEAPSYGQTIFEYEQNCHGAEDYRKVAEFIHLSTRPPAQVQAPASEAQEGTPAVEPPRQDSQPAPAHQTPDQPEQHQPAQAHDADSQTAQRQAQPSAPSHPPPQADLQKPSAPEEPDADKEQQQSKPPLEIRSIPSPDSRTPHSEYAETPAAHEHVQPEPPEQQESTQPPEPPRISPEAPQSESFP
jgi:chromosome partitioning protein